MIEKNVTFYLNKNITREDGYIPSLTKLNLTYSETEFLVTLIGTYPPTPQSVRTFRNDYIMLDPLGYRLYEEFLKNEYNNPDLVEAIFTRLYGKQYEMLIGEFTFDKRFPRYISSVNAGLNLGLSSGTTITSKYHRIKDEYTHYNGTPIMIKKQHPTSYFKINLFLKDWVDKIYGEPHTAQVERYVIKKKVKMVRGCPIVKKVRGREALNGVKLTKFQTDEVVRAEEDRRAKSDDNKMKTYLMKDKSNGYYKIGKSVNPIFRERTLRAEKPDIIKVKEWDMDIEDVLHKLFHRQRLRGEWFSLTLIQVRYICTHF